MSLSDFDVEEVSDGVYRLDGAIEEIDTCLDCDYAMESLDIGVELLSESGEGVEDENKEFGNNPYRTGECDSCGSRYLQRMN